MEGGTVYGLTAALKGEITIQNGRVVQRHFGDYPMMRHNEMPQDRGLHRAEHRGARRHRRAEHGAGGRRAAERGRRGDRQADLQPADSAAAAAERNGLSDAPKGGPTCGYFFVFCGRRRGLSAATVRPGSTTPRAALRRARPTLSDQDVGVAPREFEPVADFGCLEIHAVEDVGVLANQPTEAISSVSASRPALRRWRQVRRTLGFTRGVAVHVGAKTLSANHMPFRDGTN